MPDCSVDCSIQIEEMSAGVYKITATDKTGRQFSKFGHDPDLLKCEAYRYLGAPEKEGLAFVKRLNSNKGAIVCEHVARHLVAIRKAVRSRPVAAEDSGWQFLCGEFEGEDPKNAAIWSIQEVINHEPSLGQWIESEFDVVIEKAMNSDAWHRKS